MSSKGPCLPNLIPTTNRPKLKNEVPKETLRNNKETMFDLLLLNIPVLPAADSIRARTVLPKF